MVRFSIGFGTFCVFLGAGAPLFVALFMVFAGTDAGPEMLAAVRIISECWVLAPFGLFLTLIGRMTQALETIAARGVAQTK